MKFWPHMVQCKKLTLFQPQACRGETASLLIYPCIVVFFLCIFSQLIQWKLVNYILGPLCPNRTIFQTNLLGGLVITARFNHGMLPTVLVCVFCQQTLRLRGIQQFW